MYSINVKEIVDFCELSYEGNTVKLNDNLDSFLSNDILEKAIVRGSFLGSGSINNPEKIYHLEVIYSSEQNVDYVINILDKINLSELKYVNNDIQKMLKDKNK